MNAQEVLTFAIVSTLLQFKSTFAYKPVGQIVQLKPGVATTLTLNHSFSVELTTPSISQTYRYALFQAHSQIKPVTISSKFPITESRGSYVTSNNAGLVVLFNLDQTSASVYLQSTDVVDIKTMVMVKFYDHSDPIPGGCNMEFNVPVAPYLRVNYDPYITTVSVQRANLGYRRGEKEPSCDISYASLDYDIYVYHIGENDLSEESYFRALQRMSDANTMTQIGHKVEPFFGLSRMRFQMTTYHRQGVVVNILAKYKNVKNNVYVAPYVPAATYGCNTSGEYNSCHYAYSPFEWIFTIFGAILGLLLCLVGHRFFQSAMVSFGFLTASLIAYVCLDRFVDLGYASTTSLTVIIGIIGGAAWLFVWWVTGSPFVAVLLPSFDLGFLLACVLFFTPLGSLAMFQNDITFWVFICCVTLFVPVLLISYTRFLHILCCAVIGSYAMVVLMDNYAGGSLCYIIINVIRRATITNYKNVINLMPYQNYDIVFSVVWLGLTTIGLAFQLWRERHRPPFPVSWYQQRRLVNIMQIVEIPPPRAPELEPLISHNPNPGYRSTISSSDRQFVF